MTQPALFIDRDGTISEEIGYVNHASRYRVYPYAAAAIRRLNEAGWLAILVTNQAGVARGYFAEDLIHQVHAVLNDELKRGGARLDAIYYCPHHPAAGEPPYRADCACRKPKPGLINRAAQEFDIDLSRSWMVGDRSSDIQLAHNAGLRGAFVLSGYGRGEWEYQRHKWTAQPDLIAEDLLETVSQVLSAELGGQAAISAFSIRYLACLPMTQPNSALSTQHSALAEFIPRFAERKVVVVGDLLADQFQYGEISRVSREAPVLILRHERTETVPGGAANCAVNLAALGAQVVLVGVVGADEAGRALRESLRQAGVGCGEILELAGQPTTTKTRILAGQLHSTRQQVLRIDYECRAPDDEDLRARLAARLRKAARDADAIIISDYGYGVAHETIAAEAFAIAREDKIPCVVDSRFALANFAGATAATPNEDEVEKLLNRQFADTADLTNAAAGLREKLQLEALLVTRGSHGMLLLEQDKEPLEISAVGALEAVDVTGAGDTVIATYTLALACGASFAQAAQLANYAGGLVVMKRGTASVSAKELLKAVGSRE